MLSFRRNQVQDVTAGIVEVSYFVREEQVVAPEQVRSNQKGEEEEERKEAGKRRRTTNPNRSR